MHDQARETVRDEATATLRTGLDLVAVAEVAAALESETRVAYLARVFTAREVADCTGPRGIDARRLAVRFAAKEAALKILGEPETPIALTDVEVRVSDDGLAVIELSGAAAAAFADAGIGRLAVSVSRDREYASAFVVAEAGGRSRVE